MSAPLVFLDTETDGIHPGRRVWEVAMIRRDYDGDSVKQMETHFFVGLDLRDSDPFGLRVGGFWDRHPAGRKISGKHAAPSDFVNVLPRHEAAKEIMRWTFGAHIVGAVPSFDTETLAKMLRAEGYMPSWHHHLIDVETMALGWLLGRSNGRQHVIGYDGRTITLAPPWKSDDLSRACGVTPPEGDDRHTALGDARWVMAWYDAMRPRDSGEASDE